SFGSGGDFSPDSIYGLTTSGPNRTIGETISLRNDFTKIHGTHAFKAGYEVLRLRLNSWSMNYPSGAFRFDGMTAGLQPDGNTRPRTGNTFAGFLLGWVRQAQFDRELASWLPRSFIHSFYFQDDWKLSAALTLNLGVRYTNESPFHTKYNQVSNFDPASADDVSPGSRGSVAHPTGGLNRRDNNNFQPRIGLAWHPLAKWVFRGGFAVNTVDVKFPQSRGQFEEYAAVNNQQRPPGDPRPLYPISRGPDPVVFNIRPNGTSGFLGSNFSARGSQWWDPNLRNPYVLNWNLSTQYEINPNYLVELMYQGSAGVALVERWEVNTFPIDYAANNPVLRAAVYRTPQEYRPFPHFGSIAFRSNMGHSTYHSGTIKLEKRYSRGLTLLTFYTFSKTIDSQDTDNSGSGLAPIQNRGLEKGRAGYDRNHRSVTSLTYELPVGRGKRFLNRGGIWHRIFGGYEIAWIQTLESGNPLTFGFANSPYNYYPTWAGSRRPSLTSKPGLRDNWRDFGGDRFNQNNINPIIDITHFAYPAEFTPGSSGRNIVTGTPLIWSQCSAQKNIPISERFNFQVRWDYNNVLKTWNFNPPTTTVDFLNPRTFGKVSGNPLTASFGGIPMMHLTLQLTW
ncbi:MAG: TonB-dependent receptor, partial [Acidobacteriota bacterium]